MLLISFKIFSCTLGGGGGQITWSGVQEHPGQHDEALSLLKKNTKIIWAWWHMPVIPATQEAEPQELLEPRRQRLQWAKITPLHSSLGDTARLHLKKKKVSTLTGFMVLVGETEKKQIYSMSVGNKCKKKIIAEEGIGSDTRRDRWVGQSWRVSLRRWHFRRGLNEVRELWEY